MTLNVWEWLTDKRNGSAKMQSCSKRNELPLNAKLCVRFLFLIHAEYSKVSSFFFCADSDLRRVWPAPSLTCAEFDLRRVWPAPSLTCAEFDLRQPAPSLTCAEFDLRRVWPESRVWPAPSLTCAEFVAPKCPVPSLSRGNVRDRITKSSDPYLPNYTIGSARNTEHHFNECWGRVFRTWKICGISD